MSVLIPSCLSLSCLITTVLQPRRTACLPMCNACVDFWPLLPTEQAHLFLCWPSVNNKWRSAKKTTTGQAQETTSPGKTLCPCAASLQGQSSSKNGKCSWLLCVPRWHRWTCKASPAQKQTLKGTIAVRTPPHKRIDKKTKTNERRLHGTSFCPPL